MNGPRFLLDTNVVIGFLKGAEATRRLIGEQDAPLAAFAVSQITRMELLSFPALTAETESRIEAFLSELTILPLDERVEAAAIALRRRARLKLPDAVIAVTANVRGLTLLTLDERLQGSAVDSLR